MKEKRIVIGVKSPKEVLAKARGVMEKLGAGAAVEKETSVYFADLGSMRKVVTPMRLEIIRMVKRKKPSSVYELAKLLGRDIRNVRHDMEYLERLGLIKLKTTTSGRAKTMISADYDKILFEIAV